MHLGSDLVRKVVLEGEDPENASGLRPVLSLARGVEAVAEQALVVPDLLAAGGDAVRSCFGRGVLG